MITTSLVSLAIGKDYELSKGAIMQSPSLAELVVKGDLKVAGVARLSSGLTTTKAYLWNDVTVFPTGIISGSSLDFKVYGSVVVKNKGQINLDGKGGAVICPHTSNRGAGFYGYGAFDIYNEY